MCVISDLLNELWERGQAGQAVVRKHTAVVNLSFVCETRTRKARLLCDTTFSHAPSYGKPDAVSVTTTREKAVRPLIYACMR